MYELVMPDSTNKGPRLMASTALSAADFFDVAERLQIRPITARKIAAIAARLSGVEQQVETLWNGPETQSLAGPDDWIVTSLAIDKSVLRDRAGNPNTYVVRADRFPELYQRQSGHNEFGDFYRSASKVKAIFLAGGFEIMTPWQEKQYALSGYLLLNDGEVYGNNAETFHASYAVGLRADAPT